MDTHLCNNLTVAACKDHDSCVRKLIAAGVDPNVADNHGYAPLLWATWNGHDSCVRELLASGADPNAVNNIRQTPLQIAVKKGHRECAKVLAVRVLADRALTDDEWGLVPPGSDVGHLLPVVMTRDGRDAAAKLVARLPKEKQKVLETVAMCLSRVVLRDVVERIAVLCV